MEGPELDELELLRAQLLASMTSANQEPPKSTSDSSNGAVASSEAVSTQQSVAPTSEQPPEDFEDGEILATSPRSDAPAVSSPVSAPAPSTFMHSASAQESSNWSAPETNRGSSSYSHATKYSGSSFRQGNTRSYPDVYAGDYSHRGRDHYRSRSRDRLRRSRSRSRSRSPPYYRDSDYDYKYSSGRQTFRKKRGRSPSPPPALHRNLPPARMQTPPPTYAGAPTLQAPFYGANADFSSLDPETAVKLLRSQEQSLAQDLLKQISPMAQPTGPNAYFYGSTPPVWNGQLSQSQPPQQQQQRPVSAADLVAAAASAGISAEQLYYLSAAANQFPTSNWQTQPSQVPVGMEPYDPAGAADTSRMSLATNQQPFYGSAAPTTAPTYQKPLHHVANTEVVDMDVDEDHPVVTAAPIAFSAPPAVVHSEPTPTPVTASIAAPSPAAQVQPQPTPAVASNSSAPVPTSAPAKLPTRAPPTASAAPSARPVVVKPVPLPQPRPVPIPQPSSNLVIDFADEDSSFDEGSEVEVVPTPKAVSATPLPAIDAGISNLFAEVKSAQPDTAQKMQQMTKLREMIAQKERELEEKRKSKQGKAVPPAAAPEAVAVVPKRNPVPAKKPALPVAPTVQDTVTSASKRQKTADTATPSSAPVVNLDKVSAQVTEVFKKEEDLRQQLQQLEAAQSELLSLQRSILACKSEKSHLESRVKILQDHLKQAQQQLTQIVAKEQTLISKQTAAEKKVNDKRRAIKAAGGSLSLQRMQLKDTEIELDVKVAVESAARPAAANPTDMDVVYNKTLLKARALVKTAMRRIDESQARARSNAKPLLRSRKQPKIGQRPSKSTERLLAPPGAAEDASQDQKMLENTRRLKAFIADGMKNASKWLSFYSTDTTSSLFSFVGEALKLAPVEDHPAMDVTPDIVDDAMLIAGTVEVESTIPIAPRRTRRSADVDYDGDDQVAQPAASSSSASSRSTPAPRPCDYDSPIRSIRAYRLSPAFSALFSPLSASFSPNIDPFRVICPFEQTGSCNDDSCKYVHRKDMTASFPDILLDLASYVNTIPGTEVTPEQLVASVKVAAGREPPERTVALMLDRLREIATKAHIALPSFVATCRRPDKLPRPIKPVAAGSSKATTKPKKIISMFTPMKKAHKSEDPAGVSVTSVQPVPEESEGFIQLTSSDHAGDTDDASTRYFDALRALHDSSHSSSALPESLNSAAAFEAMIAESGPDQVPPLFWILYAQLIAGSISISEARKMAPDQVDSVLDILSRGLEAHRSSPVLWYTYLSIFPLRASGFEEITKYVTIAVKYTAPSPRLLCLAALMQKDVAPAKDLFFQALRCSFEANDLLIFMLTLFELAQYLVDAGECQLAAETVFNGMEQLKSFHNGPDDLQDRCIALCCLLHIHLLISQRVPPSSCLRLLVAAEDHFPEYIHWNSGDFGASVEEAWQKALTETSSLSGVAFDMVAVEYVRFIEATKSQEAARHVLESLLTNFVSSGSGGLLCKFIDLGADPISVASTSLTRPAYANNLKLWYYVVRAAVQQLMQSSPRVSVNAVLRLLVDAVARFSPVDLNLPALETHDSERRRKLFLRMRSLYARLATMPGSIHITPLAGPVNHPDEADVLSQGPWIWLLFAVLESLLGNTTLAEEIFQSAFARFSSPSGLRTLLWVEYFHFKQRVCELPVSELVGVLSSFLDDWSPICQTYCEASLVSLSQTESRQMSSSLQEKVLDFIALGDVQSFAPLDQLIALVEQHLPFHVRPDFFSQIRRLVPRHIALALKQAEQLRESGEENAARRILQSSLKHNSRCALLWLDLIRLEAASSQDIASLADLTALIDEALSYCPHSKLLRDWKVAAAQQ